MRRVIGVTICTTIAAVLVIALVIPTVDSVRMEPDDSWEYDDYRTADGVQSATGSLELTTINSTTYLHAKDVGEGVITYSDGHQESVKVDKALLDVVFMYGQSNAAYRNPNTSTASPVPGLGTAYYFGFSDRAGALASENSTGMDYTSCQMYDMINTTTGALRIGDKAPAFASTYYQSTHAKVYWINAAIGGQPISTFMPGAWGWQYAKAVLAEAMAEVNPAHYEVHFQGYMWIQGEGNATTPVASYKESFLTMNNAILNGELGFRFKACFISKVREANAPNPSIAELQLAEENPSIILATTIADTFTISNGLMGSDDLHYSQLGNNLIGVALGTSMADYVHHTNPMVTQGEYGLLNVIPLLVLSGLVIGLVSAIILRRD